ncbi:MAG: lytic transglycosylase domain-containing protein [Elusimicrobia bacterium]|nr:lytic transglycosylase domain-containing protein [Elusimicrobiota bacterium]
MRAVAAAASHFARTAFPGVDLGRIAWLMAAPARHAAPAQRSAGASSRRRDSAPASLVIPAPHATPAYRHTFRVLAAHPEVTDRYDALILKHARLHGLDARLVKSIIAAESEFSSSAVSPRGARGLMQVMPATAEEMGVPRRGLSDPEANIRAGAAYLDLLFRAAWLKYKLKGVPYAAAPPWLRQRVIASYNAGPRSLTNRRWRGQTRDYVRKVLLFYESPVTEPRSERASRGLPASLFGP